MNPYSIYVDCETTCFSTNVGWLGGDILSWSAIIADENGNIVDKATFLSSPTNTKYFSDEAVEIHGFNYFEALNHPSPRETAIKILHFLKPYKDEYNKPLRWVEHSLNWIDFMFTFGLFMKEDLHFSLYKVISFERRFSTIKMARKLGFKGNKLDVWAERLDYKLEHHNSESDAYCCYLIDQYLKERSL